MHALIHRLRAGGFDRCQPIGQHGRQDGYHLPVTIIGSGEPSPHPLQRGRQDPVSERCTITQRARLAGQHRHVMPRIIDRLAPAVAAAMFCDDNPVLANDDPVGVGMDLDRPTDRSGVHRVFVVVEANQAGLGDRRWHRMEAIEAARIGNELRPFCLEHLPDRLLGQLRMAVRLGIGDAFIGEPGVQLVIGFETQPRREKRSRTSPTWFSTCPFSQPDAGVQATGSTR